MADIGTILNETLNGPGGAAQGKEGTTISTFAISLAFGFILFALQFSIFLLIRNYLWAKRIFQPRSFLVPVKQRLKPPHNNPFKWLISLFRMHQDPEVIQRAGMDAYFFLRYLRMCLKIFTPMAIIILPILLPLNYRRGNNINSEDADSPRPAGFDTLAWSNISRLNSNRYWAHLILAIASVVWICFVFHQELIHYIQKRQEFLRSPAHRMKASSTTVLIQDIPEDLCNEEALQDMYGDFPGGIRRIWINRDLTVLVDKDKLRKKYEDMLENAETNMLRRAIKRSRKLKTASKSGEEPNVVAVEDTPRNSTNPTFVGGNKATTPEVCIQDLEHDLQTKAAWAEYLKPTQRYTMRIAKSDRASWSRIPLIGRFFTIKVDTIYYCRRELARLNIELEHSSENPEAYPHNHSAFIQFNSQKAAHIACQSLAHGIPSQMRTKAVEISPADINWPNLNLSWRKRYFRDVLFLFYFLLLILGFGFISAVTGILSNLSKLSGTEGWNQWVKALPKWFLSFIQGTLPPLIQVIVLSGPLPILIRLLTNRTRGSTTGSEGERSLQIWYFIFLLVELLIVPTITSGLTSVVTTLIREPGNIPDILAKNLPTASNYFFSFLIVQALSISATSLLQTIRLFKFYVIGSVNTPDSVFQKLSWTNLTRIGSNLPWYTTFAVIGMVYSVIAPLMLLFLLLTFTLFWIVIKNNLLYCVRTGVVDGAGLFFPSGINQLFTGLYLMQISLIGLFFLVRDPQGGVACDAQGIIMTVVLLLTVLYQIWLTTHLRPLYKYAPVQLEVEAQALLADYEGKRSIDSSSLPPVKRAAAQIPNKEQEEARDISGDNSRPLATVSEADQILEKEQNAENISRLQNRLSPTPTESVQVQEEEEHVENMSRGSIESTSSPGTGSVKVDRPTIRQKRSNISHRSQDLRAQQREDVVSAKHILARINRPLDEARLAQLEKRLAKAEKRAGNVLLPRRKDIEAQMLDDPISKIIMQHNDELEALDPEERDMLISVAFTHPVLREPKPYVWIPQDELGISDDEVKRTKEMFGDALDIENRGAYFDRKLKVRVDKPPPDMSEFALIMAEL